MYADVSFRGAGHLAVDYGRLHFHTEVGGDVEVGQFCVYVCVDNRQQVYADKGEDAQLAVSPESVIALLQYFRQLAVAVILVGRKQFCDADVIPVIV